ncbi:MAG: transposase [Blastocatellales bacterium]|nr:transposase [Blastocatellales bacterium]
MGRAVWGLPFLTMLAPSERYYREQLGPDINAFTERAWQAIHLIRRWLPKRTIIFVADSSFAVLELLALVSTTEGASLTTRLRLDAQLYAPAPPRKPGQKGRPRVKGNESLCCRKSFSAAAQNGPEYRLTGMAKRTVRSRFPVRLPSGTSRAAFRRRSVGS